MKRSAFGNILFYGSYLFFIIAFGLLMWKVLPAFSLWTAPVYLVCGYVILRLIFEATINRHRVPTMATSFVARQKIAHYVCEHLKETGKANPVILDLGSGRGELVRLLAKKCPHAKVIGVELAFFPFHLSRLVQKLFGPSNLSFECKDFWPYDCSKADVVFLYLGAQTAIEMGRKLDKELAKGSLVIAHVFPLAAPWAEIDHIKLHTPFEETFHIYKKA